MLYGQGLSTADAIRQSGITGATRFRWRKAYRGMRGGQLHPLKEFEKEHERKRRAIFDLTQDRQYPYVTAQGNVWAPRAGAGVSIMSAARLTSRSGGTGGYWGSTARRWANNPRGTVR